MQPTSGAAGTPGGLPPAERGSPSPRPIVLPSRRSRIPRLSGRALSAAAFLQLTALALLGLSRLFFANSLGLRLETAELLSASVAVLTAGTAGWSTAAISKRVGFWELVLGAILSTAVGYLILVTGTGFANEVFALVPEGGIWFAPLLTGGVSLLVSSLAATLGYMLGAGRSLDFSFGYELFVAKSHLRLSRPLLVGLSLLTLGIVPGVVALYLLLRKQRRSPTLIMTVLSIGGVAVGVMALCVVLSVMSGFELDLKQKILGTNAHAVVLKYGSFDEWEKAAKTTRETPGVVGVTPFVLNEVMVTTETSLAGALIKGIDPSTVGQVTELPNEIIEGNLEHLDRPDEIPVPSAAFGEPGTKGKKELDDLSDELDRLARAGARDPAAKASGEKNDLPGIVIGRELARQLKVFVGDPITVVSPIAGELGPMGPQPKSMQFRLAGVFYSGMYEYDSKFVYISLERAQGFFKLGKGVTGLELKVSDIDDARRISRNVLSDLEGYPFRVKDWGEMNRNLFSALKLEKIVMAVILAFIVLVACFNILSTLVMLVLEKGKEISILKSMGARDASVMKIFVAEGLAIGTIGTVLGLALGLLLCGAISIFPIPLDPDVYYIPRLPVRVEGVQFALVGVAAVVLAYLATIFPALYASRLSPVEGLRND
ncbi:ABC transporter permease [Vulgatibacter incomptus]|uniref:Lipoprotein releasing system transmembrane protein LolC n=1 Tax=Vulgatibacter incomptus TaxID=1391653 RepID=A0A0K1PBV9_9BACT|nr:ABC transporter permease [Vulgatibacter incomptus]AKU90604.1 Lipoprotein releasing system transmembrane protein LolC [Vulgatibacter incomptus]